MAVWNFLQDIQEPEPNFAILILNQPILCDPQLIKSLWNKAVVRVLVDGGSNRWLEFISENRLTDLKLPNFLCGDFDSVKPETRTHFEELKVNLIHTPDQDETDFTKSLRCVKNDLESRRLRVSSVFAVCENSGRFDQVVANINTLHKSNEILHNIPVKMLSSQCITWLLHPGKHIIFVKEEFVNHQFCCGLIPFCGPTLVTTSGLKWNLDNQIMEFGGLVSSSNTFAGKEINVTCNKHLIWTTQYCEADHAICEPFDPQTLIPLLLRPDLVRGQGRKIQLITIGSRVETKE